MLARLAGFDPHLEEAAMDLGANYPTTLRRIVLPIIAPAMVSAWLTAFTVSFDEFALALFLAGTEPTFPVYLFSQLRFQPPADHDRAGRADDGGDAHAGVHRRARTSRPMSNAEAMASGASGRPPVQDVVLSADLKTSKKRPSSTTVTSSNVPARVRAGCWSRDLGPRWSTG